MLEQQGIDPGDVLDDEIAVDHIALRLEQQSGGERVGNLGGERKVGVAGIDAVAQLRLVQPPADIPLTFGIGDFIKFRLALCGGGKRGKRRCGDAKQG